MRRLSMLLSTSSRIMSCICFVLIFCRSGPEQVLLPEASTRRFHKKKKKTKKKGFLEIIIIS
jgi:hypothetical protein